MNMATPLTDFLHNEYARQRVISEGTIYQLQIAIERFGEWLGRTPVLADLNDGEVTNLVIWAEQKQGYKPKYIKNLRGAMISLWNHGFEYGFIEVPPSRRIRKVKVNVPIPDAWDYMQISEWMEATSIFRGEVMSNGIKRDDWWLCYGAMAYESALRPYSDLLSVQFSWIDKRRKFKLIQQKTGDPHIVELSENCIYFISRIREPERKVILEWPYSKRYFYIDFHEICKKAGLTGTPKFFRRSAATHADNKKAGSATELLGHRTPGMARKHYIDRSQKETTTVPVPISIPDYAAPALPAPITQIG